MSYVFLSIAPVFILISLGAIFKKTLIKDKGFWRASSHIVYWVLMPAMLFYQASSTDMVINTLGQYMIAILPAFLTVFVLSLAISFAFSFNAKTITSVLQGSVRHNTFIVFAIASQFFGEQGLLLASLIMVFLIPLNNISVIGMMTILLRNKKSQNPFLNIVEETFKNPIFLSITIGLMFSLLGFRNIEILHDTAQLLGKAALPLMLLIIGANMQLNHIFTKTIPILIPVLMRIVVFPVIIFITTQYLELTQTQSIIALIFGAVPASASAPVLAKQMGGDANLMSSIIATQTVVCFASIPLLIYLLY